MRAQTVAVGVVLGLSVLLVLSVSAVGCRSGSSTPGVASVDFRRARAVGVTGGTWVARYRGESVTDAELSASFARMNPYARARYQTVEQRREFLDGLLRYELLAQEAVRQDLANDPEVVDAAKRVMVSLLLRRELEEKAAPPTDAQVAKYYEEHQGDYVKPAMTRLSHLSFSKDHRAEAEAALETVKALPPLDYASFAALARERSEDPRTKQLDGDMRFLSDEELSQQYGPELVPVAAALRQVGDVAPQLVETQKALHVVKLQGRQIALNLSMEQARPSIQTILLNDSKQARFRELLERLKKEAGTEVNDAALAAIVVDPKAPAVDAKGPQPGYVAGPTVPQTK